MAKLHSPGDTVPFYPPGQEGVAEDQRVAYLFRVPSVVDEAAYERGCVEAGVQQWNPIQILSVMAEGVRAILTDEADAELRDGYLADIDAMRLRLIDLAAEHSELQGAQAEERAAWVSRWNEAMADRRISDLEAVIADHYPRLRRMLGDNQVAQRLRGMVAARLFLTGWANRPGVVRRGIGGVDDATLAQIPRALFPAMARFVEGLMVPSEEEVGNSESPSGGASAAAPSPAASTPPESTP